MEGPVASGLEQRDYDCSSSLLVMAGLECSSRMFFFFKKVNLPVMLDLIANNNLFYDKRILSNCYNWLVPFLFLV